MQPFLWKLPQMSDLIQHLLIIFFIPPFHVKKTSKEADKLDVESSQVHHTLFSTSIISPFPHSFSCHYFSLGMNNQFLRDQNLSTLRLYYLLSYMSTIIIMLWSILSSIMRLKSDNCQLFQSILCSLFCKFLIRILS